MMGGQYQQQQQPGMYNSLSWSGQLLDEWINVTLPAFPLTKKSIQGMNYVLRNLEPDHQYEARIHAK